MSEPTTLTHAVKVSEGSMRILLVAPSPINNPARLHSEAERRRIFGVLHRFQVDAVVIRLNPPTVEALRTALSIARFDIVHVATHCHRDKLEFENEDGTATRISSEEFAQLFAGYGESLLVLNGCFTEPIGNLIVQVAPQVATVSIAAGIARSDALHAVESLYGAFLSGKTIREVATNASADVERRKSKKRTTDLVRARSQGTDMRLTKVRSNQLGRARPRSYNCFPKTNLPLSHKQMFDRENETLELYGPLCHGESDTAFIGVVGLTGNGKTTLVQAVARRYGWRFPDGVGYFSLRAEFSSTLLGRVFGWDLSAIPDDTAVREVADRLSEGVHLLIFDDFDDASEASAEELIALLDAWDTSLGGRVIVICHSRHERLRGLIGPNWVALDELPDQAAEELLESHLQRAPQDGAQLKEIARLCHRHPRTIETAAASLNEGQPWSDLREDLVRMHPHGPLGANDEILGRVIERLERRAPQVANYLDAWSVFGDRCEESSWRFVTAGSTGRDEVLKAEHDRAMRALHSALMIDRYVIRNRARCVMHPLVVAHLRRRHEGLSAEMLTEFARRQLKQQTRLATEQPDDYPNEEAGNIRQALGIAENHSLWSEIVDHCMAVVGHPNIHLVRRGPWPMALELLRIGERAAANSGDRRSEAQLLVVQGTVQYRLAAFGPSADAYERAAQLAHELGAHDVELDALRGKGQVLYRAGDVEAAGEVYDSARVLAEQVDATEIADIDHQRGKVLYRKGQLSEAREVFQSVRTVREEAGPSRDLAKTIHELARVEHKAGNRTQARALYEEALRIERQIKDPVSEQATLFQLGRLALEEHDVEEAKRRFAESRRISQSLDDRVWVVHARYADALVALEEDQRNAAVEIARSAQEEARHLRIGLASEIDEWLRNI
jgi:tetratricopeptide (TPR) repeat protein